MLAKEGSAKEKNSPPGLPHAPYENTPKALYTFTSSRIGVVSRGISSKCNKEFFQLKESCSPMRGGALETSKACPWPSQLMGKAMEGTWKGCTCSGASQPTQKPPQRVGLWWSAMFQGLQPSSNGLQIEANRAKAAPRRLRRRGLGCGRGYGKPHESPKLPGGFSPEHSSSIDRPNLMNQSNTAIQ